MTTALATQQKKLAIVGLARDVGKSIRSQVEHIEDAFCEFEDISWFVIESDSTDNSVEELERLASGKNNFRYKALGNLSGIYPVRTERIAHCRNEYIAELDGDPAYSEVDYVAVVDLDGVNHRLSKSAVSSCFKRTDWDVCCANQLGNYYDVWALRHEEWSPNDCWQHQRFLENYGISRFRSIRAAVYDRMIKLPATEQWIEVDSAFGGCAIYKKEVLSGVSYLGLGERGEEVCEHVSMHRQIRERGGRIYINPGLINADYVEHARYATKFGLLRLWFYCQRRRILVVLGLTE